ncbi:hypothetical protein RAC89_26615 [Paenibacillus sp. GD4]|uniref:hypothetical protein n=1 Tax=Paenibacillus sp. GD4 TaxID=3068890 RepID=UPI002796BF53|nr:hypothetical protein [Paenibacillus sp. GD4]MDQ1913979.1 hypothetical protein [Paenibacillus sp. GD4]
MKKSIIVTICLAAVLLCGSALQYDGHQKITIKRENDGSKPKISPYEQPLKSLLQSHKSQ